MPIWNYDVTIFNADVQVALVKTLIRAQSQTKADITIRKFILEECAEWDEHLKDKSYDVVSKRVTLGGWDLDDNIWEMLDGEEHPLTKHTVESLLDHNPPKP